LGFRPGERRPIQEAGRSPVSSLSRLSILPANRGKVGDKKPYIGGKSGTDRGKVGDR
jgi:hypothetical protein